MSAGPLSDLFVIDLTRALAGPHAGMMLGDLGARVIKIEAPGGGDQTRDWGPPFVGEKDAEESTYFLGCNRNKESITLDLKAETDVAVLSSMLEQADVLLENFLPGTLERLGFTDERLTELNPRLVTMSISGFGHDGPEGGRAGYDQIAQGEAGLMSLTGSAPDDPQRVGVPIGDLLAGMYGAFGVLASLLERVRTGQGGRVRTSLLASIVGVHAFQGSAWTVAGKVGAAAGNHHPSIAPYGLFKCRDGAIQIAVGSPRLWEKFCAAFGMDAADARFADNAARVDNRDVLIEKIEAVFAERDAAELLAALDAAGIPAGKVRSLDEVYEWDQTRSQGLIISTDHSTLGPIDLPGPPLRFFDGTGTETTNITHLAPPLLNEHGEALRHEFAKEN
ncbi:CaiB/BaiF CoA transferase family protein [Demequina aurantiaca]|uniref:CaiB/BaiF CoA transferase family protein n=1 Tax=Demequina aurantiaca TaxID=676200 RepID=UPI0007825E5B|nr:CoA transferase [Demequina aurantiaca]